ncbi:hypothetical protein [Streptomyces liangshanensis]|uniref:Uncharacterized protein n=1 Tax=Streptomyces liangshanensis TaxID=2717324 RepID=A0A6G9H3A2_9ACTN|nr:hypothetical protein [Streptomyces liangshanensis]QIQ04607.1 hypothetical protein HA039_22030 [Streptomyces liangshanensis]
MHADIHLMLHSEKSAELQRRAAESRRAVSAPRITSPGEPGRAWHALRARLGWALVEWGLRLASRPHAREIPLA